MLIVNGYVQGLKTLSVRCVSSTNFTYEYGASLNFRCSSDPGNHESLATATETQRNAIINSKKIIKCIQTDCTHHQQHYQCSLNSIQMSWSIYSRLTFFHVRHYSRVAKNIFHKFTPSTARKRIKWWPKLWPLITRSSAARIVTRGLLYQNVYYSDVIVGSMASQITSLTIVYWAVYSGADQAIHQSSASQVFVPGIHRWPINSRHK